MATHLVRVLASGELSCGHRAHPATTRAGPGTGDVYCGLCALGSIDALTAELAAMTATEHPAGSPPQGAGPPLG
jgi:hypothetical protein